MDPRFRATGGLPRAARLGGVTLAGSSFLLAGAATAAPAAYAVEARTLSGMGAGASGMEMMRLMMGGAQPTASRSLTLTLASSQRPAAPQAQHQIPAGLGLGSSLPLLSSPDTPASPIEPADMPRGRLVVFRGCAGSPGADQPEVIDLAGLRPEQRRLAELLARRGGPAGSGPTQASGTGTSGHWPNRQSSQSLPAGASLVGEHRVLSNYAPELRFAVTPSHDFLAPVSLTTRASAGTFELSWTPVAGALGSQAMAFGGQKAGEELVLWTSSTAPWGESGVRPDLDAPTARRLIAKGVLMPPEQSRCTIGAAAMQRLGTGMVQLTAYGDTLRVAGPATGQGSRAPSWTVELVRASTSSLPLIAAGAGDGSAPGEAPSEKAPERRGGWGLIPGLF